MPPETSNPLTLLEIAKTFGVGIAALSGWIFFLLRDIKDYKEKERIYAKELLDLSKENIATMQSLTQVVEALAPAISHSSHETHKDIEQSVTRIKEHITNQYSLIEKIISKKENA
jgi:hypothetical protein